jgi:hypothetical protein
MRCPLIVGMYGINTTPPIHSGVNRLNIEGRNLKNFLTRNAIGISKISNDSHLSKEISNTSMCNEITTIVSSPLCMFKE